MRQRKQHDNKPVAKLKSNKIGNSENAEHRKKALKTVDRVTPARAETGWAWIKKLGTRKQVAPAKVEGYILEGWALV